MEYDKQIQKLKAISDPKRLKIIDLLSCGEYCGCNLLEHFEFTQPTLSHHMKVLIASGLVESRKEGLWTYYKLCESTASEFMENLKSIFSETEDCICKTIQIDCNNKEITNEVNSEGV